MLEILPLLSKVVASSMGRISAQRKARRPANLKNIAELSGEKPEMKPPLSLAR